MIPVGNVPECVQRTDLGAAVSGAADTGNGTIAVRLRRLRAISQSVDEISSPAPERLARGRTRTETP